MDEEKSRLRFIDEPVEVLYQKKSLLEKKPKCPGSFIWQEKTFEVHSLLMEWVDYSRRGRMARNMTDTHSAIASGKGSWGVGRFFFRVETDNGRVFDLYYDRAPRGCMNRKGQWFIFKEILK